MRGRVVDWNDQRGFGFIASDTGDERFFFHISDMTKRSKERPEIGDVVSFDVASSLQAGKSRAVRIETTGPWWAKERRVKRLLLSVFALTTFPILWTLVKIGEQHIYMFWAVSAVSAIAFCSYYADKVAAQGGERRTPEATLQILALFGGWPGALLAQQLFRHKSSKRSFQVKFWLNVVFNVAILGLMSRSGSAAVRRLLEIP